jgi:uncharacterized protein
MGRVTAAAKEQRLLELLAGLDSVIVAYSGGVDSAYLACTATRALGDRALCVTGDSPSYPDHHREMALEIARDFSLRHEIIPTGELDNPSYRANPANRCYFCKQDLYGRLTALARARGIRYVVDGNNADDRGDYRPGRQAAREAGVRSPLDEAGLTKSEIRELSRRIGLSIWDEPASACLSSRIPYHDEVTEAKLRMVERAEQELRSLGFRHCRVRHHDAVARLELPREEMARVLEPDVADAIATALRTIGYRYVALDLIGYRTGSLNEMLQLTIVE